MTLQVTLLLLAAAGLATVLTWAGSREVAPPGVAKPPPFIPPTAPLVSATRLYRTHCASCHGASGDGRPSVKLDRPPRSFLEGGFSFGNTTEAISRVIRSGIPGSPMQAFGHVLDNKEVAALATHVQSFGPPGMDAATSDAEMVVGVRPIIVHGQLGPVVDERAAHPRAVVIGNPDGMTWVYRADDVRLLAVRQGRFVFRSDWGGRGGTPLELLGEPLLRIDDGDPSAMFSDEDGSPLKARLRSTSIAGSLGVLRYDIVDDGDIIASIEETAAPHARGTLVGLRRTLDVETTSPLYLQVHGHLILILEGDIVAVHHRDGGEEKPSIVKLEQGAPRVTVTHYIVNDLEEATLRTFWEALQ